ncbi:MAG: exo-alpha-sialidase, partial [Armatimonadaceae bacterium]
FLLSAPLDSDWMDAANWIQTNRLGYDPGLIGGRFQGWCEGNAVELPGGGVGNFLRVHTLELPEQGGVLRASDDGRVLHSPDRETFRDFPGGCKKFTVRKDPRSAAWWSLTSVARRRHDGVPVERTRNELALVRSTDLKFWEIRAIVLRHPDVRRHGFQYADWIFDGDDLLAVVRTAWDDAHGGAHSQHDANYLTFHRIARFRDRLEPLPD